jgi:hypothetical protein
MVSKEVCGNEVMPAKNYNGILYNKYDILQNYLTLIF